MAARGIRFRDGDVLLLVGTVKGAFLLRSGKDRRRFDPAGPFFPGRAVYAMAWDDRAGRRRLWAAAQSLHWGATLHRSDDFGATWTDPDAPLVKFPAGSGATLRQIWQIRPGREDEPEVLYCGVEPAALFESRDGGETWALVRGLWQHPHRPRWTPRGGGQCLHTVLPHPADRRRMLVAVSTGGVYRTTDGGRSWGASNAGIRAEFLPDKHPEFGQCVHKVDFHPSRPDRLFLQNHFGLYRSDDWGASWRDIAKGVPSDFGFPIAVHPHEPDTAYVVPLRADEFRWPPDARMRVYRTRNAGRSWQGLDRGLPRTASYEAVLRDALAVDSCRPAGVYFGTRGGRVFGSRSGGASWELVADGLPAVTCVKTAALRR